ncbi:MAG: HPF/RaiA family ribosome-associated protein [candidate division Zixibacteria bacterium]|nr:HPF/RaiA family ribosome-associated protein [candidate division Zixibacteria bacterium]
MQVPLELTFRGFEKDTKVEEYIIKKLDKLERISEDIISCRVVIEKPQEHQKSGNPYRLRLNIRVPPEKEIVISRDPGDLEMHKQLMSVVKDAFDAATRQLKEIKERRRAEVKAHPVQQTDAIVSKIFKDEGYGFLKTLDNRDIYFHENAVLGNDFDRLEVGTGVRFVETDGDKGPQATTVQIVDKPGARSGSDSSLE